jgi:CheY-like chemotaxis protein
MLEGWNCEVVSAETGEEALEAGDREGWRFDAVIADHRLGPGLTGTDTAAEIRRRSGQPIPTLIVTGDTAPERIEEVHASGFEMMHKPVTPDELARSLARLLRGGGNGVSESWTP